MIDILTSVGLEALSAVVAIFLTAVSAVLASYLNIKKEESTDTGQRQLLNLNTELVQAIKDDKKSIEVRQREHLQKRLKEVSDKVAQLDLEARVNKYSNGFLITGQYVVGAVLASSFIQDSLSNDIVGILGLVVLVATIVHQRLRPDLKSRVSSAKADYLRANIRKSQDNLVVENPNFLKIIAALTRSLNKAEKEEEWEVEENNNDNPI